MLLLVLPPPSPAYSVLTHEQLIDLSWNALIRPLLQSRYPHANSEDLEEAHAYAYGGCAIQDMGYYPFGKEFFSELTHYVRTGDFIMSLLRNARTLNEYAFAIGALSHYIGDNIGHHDAVNRATAINFEKLAKAYGSSVTYDEGPHAHVRTEFAFDIAQLTQYRLAPTAYLEHIGFRVSRTLLERAFAETYALSLGEVLGPEGPAIRSYTTSVRRLVPRFAHAEAVIHRHNFVSDTPNKEFQLYMQRVSHTDFEKVWSPLRRKPGILTYLLALVVRITPPIGAASDLSIKVPTEQTEDLYITSVNRSVELFQSLLTGFKNQPRSIPPIPNRDLDTGERSKPGGYSLTDQTYAKLLHRVTSDPSRQLPAGLAQDLLDYYADPNAPIRTKRNPKAWKQVLADLTTLRLMADAKGVTGP